MTNHTHTYSLETIWEGNRGAGTKTYAGYGRGHRLLVSGKPDIPLTADLAFRGDPGVHNPEELLVAALSSCHMLSYLALCAREGINVTSYHDAATGTMVTDTSGSGRFTEVTLHPKVVIANAERIQKARELHEMAHHLCFIANSVNFPVRCEASVGAE